MAPILGELHQVASKLGPCILIIFDSLFPFHSDFISHDSPKPWGCSQSWLLFEEEFLISAL